MERHMNAEGAAAVYDRQSRSPGNVGTPHRHSRINFHSFGSSSVCSNNNSNEVNRERSYTKTRKSFNGELSLQPSRNGVEIFFRCTADTNPHDSQTTIPWIHEGKLSLPKDYYLDPDHGQPEPEERWVWLLGYLNQHAGHLLGKLYCDACFPSSSKEHVMEIARTVIEEQKKLISEVEWMEDNTKAHAHEKLNNLLLKVGCPDNYEDYSTFTPSKKDSFVAIIRQLSVFNMKTNLLLANKPTDREKWLVAPQEADGFYHIFRNELILPAGILQGFFYDPDRDLCANYGAIGAVIGHECIHGYDESGKEVNSRGNMVNWWSYADTIRYKRRVQLIVEQYSSIEVTENHFINGQLTVGENIADIGGLKCAYHAMQTALKKHPEANRVVSFSPLFAFPFF
ncbi:hypothetical protein Zmor_028511 [Zophobas morio]|uniref:Uncharacterized protein n=1 Tax=Zophobas morio TaxID=2755281 RepID=A0AA38HIY8_9CUCU|nr:hypothetical protein Zmor_028511 [Zophobas morio]